ncbi:MAG: phosphatidate cytidylyltransferase [Alistipes sp.]|nr:phosphatidate cytidylyltransferase [Alistipes sp.]
MSDKLKNLVVRTLSGAVLLGVVLAAALLGKYAYGALLLVIVSVGLAEFYRLAKASGAQPQVNMGTFAGVILFCTSFHIFEQLYDGYPLSMELIVGLLLSLLLYLFLIFVVEVFRAKEHPLRNVAVTIMSLIYVSLPMSLMLFIPLMLGGGVWRAEAFLFYLFIVWGNDVFAYLVGVSIGRHRMCERISPKKSWEGFVGGVLGAMAMGALGNVVVGGGYALWLGLAAIVAISSVLGDLVESMFKREAGVKDSGNIMPGHGGILDRFDALLVSIPFAFIYLMIVRMFDLF